MILHECKVCGYLYNPQKGDASGNIPVGTLFQDIPQTWECPICGSKKEIFIPREERM